MFLRYALTNRRQVYFNTAYSYLLRGKKMLNYLVEFVYNEH